MKLILQKDVKNLGKTGDQVSVKKGFARNYLIPKGYAVLMNKNRLKVWEHQKVIIESKKRKAISERKALIEKLSSIKLKFEKEAQKDNRLFGSVTAHEISQALENLHKLSIDKRDIHFSELKTVGEHSALIKLDSENQTEIKLSIKGKVRKADYENKEKILSQSVSDDSSSSLESASKTSSSEISTSENLNSDKILETKATQNLETTQNQSLSDISKSKEQKSETTADKDLEKVSIKQAKATAQKILETKAKKNTDEESEKKSKQEKKLKEELIKTSESKNTKEKTEEKIKPKPSDTQSESKNEKEKVITSPIDSKDKVKKSQTLNQDEEEAKSKKSGFLKNIFGKK